MTNSDRRGFFRKVIGGIAAAVCAQFLPKVLRSRTVVVREPKHYVVFEMPRDAITADEWDKRYAQPAIKHLLDQQAKRYYSELSKAVEK